MASLLSLPLEVRAMIYKFLVTPPHGINPFHNEHKSLLHPNLLYVSFAVFEEYREIFYSETEFSFEGLTSKSVADFLTKIGRQNAGFIRHIYIDLPKVYTDDPDDYCNEVKVEENSERILRKIKSDCTGLRMLIINLSKASGQLKWLRYINSELPYYDVAISVLNRRFRGIPSLRSIKVEIPVRGQWTKVISEMEKNGWVIDETGGKWPDEHGIENEESSDGYSENNYNEYEEGPWDEEDDYIGLPLEIRHMVYRYLMPTESMPICPCPDFDNGILHFNLLRTNKLIYQEYRSILYSEIPFDLEAWTVELITRWFDRIGPHNAGLIREIYILFPRVYTKRHSDEPACVIDERHVLILDKIQSVCTGLRVLVINLPDSIMQLQEIEYGETQRPGYVTDAIALVNKRLREIPSLETIEAEFPTHVERTEITHEMQRHGWTIKDIEAEWPSSNTDENRRSDSEALLDEAEAGLHDFDDGDPVADDMANRTDYIPGIIGGR